jgi:hypothetical protein
MQIGFNKMKKKKNEGLTVKKLREITGINYTDEEAEKIVYSIKQFVSICYQFIQEEQVKAEKVKQSDNF